MSPTRTRAENADYVLAKIEAIGVHLPPGSRLFRMHDALVSRQGIIPWNDPDFETALEAERDLQVLGFVFDVEDAHSEDVEFCKLVKKAIKDSLLPSADKAQSRGRDAQFELLVAAICKNANMLPVAREEPDVICHVEGLKFGIAAKRLKSVARLRERICDAASQIETAHLPGIIAIDTSLALNPDNVRITKPMPDDEFGRQYAKAMESFTDGVHAEIQEWVRGKGVRGIMLHDQQVRFCPDGQWSLAGMTIGVNTARINQRRNREYDSFYARYSAGLPCLERL